MKPLLRHEKGYYLPEPLCALPVQPHSGYMIDRKNLGRGAYGSIRTVTDSSDGTSYAVKIQKLVEDGDLVAAVLREIAVMRRMCLPDHHGINVISLLGIIHLDRDKIGMILPLAQGDLFHMSLDQHSKTQRARYAYQVTSAVAYLHSRDILHRDIKTHNILYDAAQDRMLLADFGLVRTLKCVSSHNGMTQLVFTLMYRPPEILLGGSKYSTAADVWALGCVLYEIMEGKGSAVSRILFNGNSEIDQLLRIFRRLGTPTEAHWPGVTNFPEYKSNFPKWKAVPEPLFPRTKRVLFNKCFIYDPAQRISAANLLKSEYFKDIRDRDDEPIPLTCLDNLYLNEPPLLPSLVKIERQRRDIVVNWLLEVSTEFKLRHHTFFMGVYLLDRYGASSSREDIQRHGAAALYVASTYHEVYPTEVYKMVSVGDDAYTSDDLRTTAKHLLDRCNYHLIFSTSMDFLDQYCLEFYSEEVAVLARTFLHLGLFQDSHYVYTPHEEALWAIYWACQYHDLPYKHESLLSAESIQHYPLRGPSNPELTAAVDMIHPKASIAWEEIRRRLA